MSLFGRDDTKQAKCCIFIVVPQVGQFPKVPKKKLECYMLLEPIVIAIINLFNLQVVPDKVF